MATSTSTRSFPTGIDCPVDGCKTSGSEPGLKRHITKKHNLNWTDFFEVETPVKSTNKKVADAPVKAPIADLIKAPVTNTPLANRKADELRQMAKNDKIAGWHKMTKTQLVEALSA